LVEDVEPFIITKAYDNVRLIVALCVVLCVCGVTAQPLKQRAGYGMVNEFSTPKNPQELFVANVNESFHSEFGVRSRNVFSLFRKNSFGFWVKKEFSLHQQSLSVTVGDFNNDGMDDIVFLESSPATVEVFWGSARDFLYSTLLFTAKQSYEKILAADINGDGFKDMLLFGKKTQGIGALMQSKDGEFRLTATLCKEISVGEIAVADVNHDGAVDFFVLDWMNNSVHLFTQRGKMKFTSQYVWKFDNAVNNIEVRDVNDDAFQDVVVSFDDGNTLSVYYGDEFGDYQRLSNVPLESPTTDFVLCDVDNDANVDIAYIEKTSLNILWNAQENPFQQHIVYAARENATDILSASLEGKYEDIIVLDQQQGKIIEFVHTQNAVKTLEQKQHYATGLQPKGLLAFDFSRDGIADILVANEGSHSISFFENAGNGKFNGQIAIDVENVPSFFRVVNNGTSNTLFVTHEQNNSVSILNVNEQYTSTIAAIPTAPHPTLHYAEKDSFSLRKNFIVECRNDGASSVSTLYAFQEIPSSQFIEQSISFGEKQQVLGAFVADISNDGVEDIVFAAFDEQIRRVSLFLSKGKHHDGTQKLEREFSAPSKILSLADSTASRVLLWNADINRDSQSDIIGNINGNTNTLFFSLRSSNTSFQIPIQRIKNVHISRNEHAHVADVNSDGHVDILFYNEATQAIQVCYGRGEGTFLEPENLIAVSSLGSFIVGNFNNDALMDIAFTDAEKGTLTIQWGK
jgi:hypothetical protein